METWFIVILSAIAVLAVAVLLFFELMGDEPVQFRKKKHRRGKYINDQTAVIYQSIIDTSDPYKAYNLFTTYINDNHKMFLDYVGKTLYSISLNYNNADIPALRRDVAECMEMKFELKDQRVAKANCLASIDRVAYIDTIAWIHLANSCRFTINDAVQRMAEVCVEYLSEYSEPFPAKYAGKLGELVVTIGDLCERFIPLVGSTDIAEMRTLRKDMSAILTESYAVSQRIYDLIHDGRTEMSEEKRIAMMYSLNAYQELHSIIYTLRRFVLANIGISLSIINSPA